MRVEMIDVQQQILREIEDPLMTRDDVAFTYAFGLRSSEIINWAAVNRAIMDRWSVSALTYIKEKAWKRVEGR